MSRFSPNEIFRFVFLENQLVKEKTVKIEYIHVLQISIITRSIGLDSNIVRPVTFTREIRVLLILIKCPLGQF